MSGREAGRHRTASARVGSRGEPILRGGPYAEPYPRPARAYA